MQLGSMSWVRLVYYNGDICGCIPALKTWDIIIHFPIIAA